MAVAKGHREAGAGLADPVAVLHDGWNLKRRILRYLSSRQ
jgi:hypothetical protein